MKKLTDYLVALNKMESRPDVARFCAGAALVILAVSFVPDLILVMDFSRPYQLAQFSQDEYWFMEAILQLQNAFLVGDWHAIRDFGSPFAYGFPFWLITALIALPTHAHAMLMALFLRFLFIVTKYAAFYVVYRRILALTQKPLLSLLSLALMLIVPAFVFDDKVVSPEFLIMLLLATCWSLLFLSSRRAQVGAAFVFALALTIKFNVAPLGLFFPVVLFTRPAKQRLDLLCNWIFGAVVPLLLFLVPAHPFKEILAVGATHGIDYGFEYLAPWYSANVLEFDDVLIGGWSIDFLSWPLFLFLSGYALYRAIADKPKNRTALTFLIVGTFFIAVLVCFMTSLTSLMHPWFVFAPFLLMMGAGSLLIGTGREATAVMLAFFLIYGASFGERYLARWQHRIDKFETIAASESDNAEASEWIARNCPQAREGVIDYNLIWPAAYDRQLKKMWTIIEVEDYRRAYQDATVLLDKIDLLLIKTDRMRAISQSMGPLSTGPMELPGMVLGNFFPNSAPYFAWQHDFPQLSIFAREGACKKGGS